MRDFILKALLVICCFLGIVIYTQFQQITAWKADFYKAKANEKSLLIEKDSLHNANRVLYLTIDELNYYNDSIVIKLNDARKELKIKDKDIKSLQYQLSEITKKDTIVFRDTLFKDPNLQIDTLLGDEWYQLQLGLKYPSTIAVEPTFISERAVLTSLKKETINPPKKTWIGRLFQRKHKVLTVEVVESNPYISNKQEKHIEIVK